LAAISRVVGFEALCIEELSIMQVEQECLAGVIAPFRIIAGLEELNFQILTF
jgi:hypothetical protein